MKLIFTKGPSLHIRFISAFILAIALIVSNNHLDAFIQFRSYLDTLVSPLYYLANMPRGILDDASETVMTRQEIQLENKALYQELLQKNSELMLLEQFKQENARLRELLGSPLRQDELKMVAQVITTNFGPYSYQVVIDKGKRDGVYEGQPVIDDKGVVGQIYSVANNTSRVILLCDPLHGLPIQVLRNDTRVVALGAGCGEPLQLEYLPNNIDIKVGDTLVTSGLDGRFPEGYPVAVVSSVKEDHQHGRLVINADPTASLKRLRYLLLLWTDQQQKKNALATSSSLAAEAVENRTEEK